MNVIILLVGCVISTWLHARFDRKTFGSDFENSLEDGTVAKWKITPVNVGVWDSALNKTVVEESKRYEC